MTHFGQRVARQRVRLGWTQVALAVAIGVRPETINRLERDGKREPRAEAVKKLALVLGCTTDYLLGMHEEGTHGD